MLSLDLLRAEYLVLEHIVMLLINDVVVMHGVSGKGSSTSKATLNLSFIQKKIAENDKVVGVF